MKTISITTECDRALDVGDRRMDELIGEGSCQLVGWNF